MTAAGLSGRGTRGTPLLEARTTARTADSAVYGSGVVGHAGDRPRVGQLTKLRESPRIAISWPSNLPRKVPPRVED